jgi:hypothetical protein
MVCAGAVISQPGFAEGSITLDQLLSKDQQAKLGVSTMRLDQREILRQALIGLFQRGYQVGRSDGLSVARQSPSALPPQTVVESQIDGDFNGWEGETIVKLMNGQIWQQTEYHYEYNYAYMPNVLVYPSGGGYKMIHAARRIATGSPSNSACQLPGRRATLVAIGPGFGARPTSKVGTAAAGSHCSTALAIYSHVGTVTASLMPAGRRRPRTAVLIGRERSGCASAAVPTCYSRFRKGRAECTGELHAASGARPFCTIRSQVTLKWLSPLKLRHLPAAR